MNENKKCCTGVEKLFCNANCSVVKGSKVHQLHSYNYLYFLNTIAGFDFIHSRLWFYPQCLVQLGEKKPIYLQDQYYWGP